MANATSEQISAVDESGTENTPTLENVSIGNVSDSENLSLKDSEIDENVAGKPVLCFDMKDAINVTEAWTKVDESYKKQAKSLKAHVKYAKAIDDMVKKAAKKRVKDRSNKKEWEELFKRAVKVGKRISM